MKYLLIIFFFLSFIIPKCFPQKEKPEIHYYSARDYGKGHEASNKACVQDKNGVLYFGNAGGLLQYDGAGWNFIPVKQSIWIHALAVSSENVIFLGGQNEFGYLTPEGLSYVSLSDQLPENHKLFSNIIRVWALNMAVVFQSEEAIFLYAGGKLSEILPETSFHNSFLVNDELFVRQRGIGIMKLAGPNLELVEGTDFFKDFGVFSIMESSDHSRYIIITREDGFWSMEKKNLKISPLKTADSTFMNRAEIYGAIILHDGKIAFNTLSAGIIFTDEQLKIESVINKDYGLKVDGVLSLLEDFQGSIWATLDNGIAQIHYSSPLSVFGPESGISGNINAISRFNGNLFLGTTDGLFILQENENLMPVKFALYHGFSKETWSLCNADNSLLVGTQDGLFELSGNEIKKIEDVQVRALHYSEKLKLLFVAGKRGVALYVHSGKWVKTKIVQEISEEVSRFCESGNHGDVTIWLGTPLQGVLRFQFKSQKDFFVDKYNSADGLNDNDWTYPFFIDGKMIFSQHTGLLEFVDEEAMKRQLPDSLKNNQEFYRGYFDFVNIGDSKEHVGKPFYTMEESENRIYANIDGDLGYFDKTQSFAFSTQPFRLADIGKANIIYPEDNGVCWIGGDDGLVMFNERKTKNYSTDFCSLITSVSFNEDSVLFKGYGDAVGKFLLDYDLNNVTFSFSAPFFEGQENMQYSYLLIGHDSVYGTWRKDNRAVYTNLWEGEYIFKVRAKNIYGHVSSESSLRFTILPPWYRTIWAYLCFMIFFVILVFLGIKINSQRLIAKNKKLEEIILERTQEIKQQNLVLEHQKKEIVDSINYAQRIQKAVLPDNDLSKVWLGDHFILFRPKDIVSGDFYWTTKFNQYVYFCVADCTGHGVPGAFMSMLCISFLNEVALKEEITQSDEVLGRVRKRVVESLKQKGLSGEQKDGMDIALCILNQEKMELQYSGANNPVYIVRDKKAAPIPCDKQQDYGNLNLFEIKGDAMPIAIHVKMEPFKKHTIKLLKEDRIFLSSDGFPDQFGGPKGKKFMYKPFKKTLMQTISGKMEDQKNLLGKQMDDWISFKNDEIEQTFEQVDDICVMGIMI